MHALVSCSERFQVLNTQQSNFNKILKRTMRLAKRAYLTGLFQASMGCIKNTWKNINTILSKNKPKKYPEIFINRIHVKDPQKIACHFNDYFSGIRSKLAPEILRSDNPFSSSLPAPVPFSFKFSPVTTEDVIKAINNLPSKSSSGEKVLIAFLLNY